MKSVCHFLWLWLLLAACPGPAGAQLVLVENGKPKAEIRLVDDQPVNRQAAELLNHFVAKITGTTLPLQVGEAPARKGSVVIGGTTAEAGEDGFLLECREGCLTVRSGGDKGAVYGVVTLLEEYLGVRYYAYQTYTLTERSTLRLPALRRAETPAFRFRQTFSYGNDDPLYVPWFRLERQEELFADNLWVHTFNRLLPASQYGSAHPEYYSFLNGERRPGDHSQWCLTCPEVLELVTQKVDSIFKAHPGQRMISISQNDGNNTYCQCEECRKVDEYEGSPSGNIIRFLNRLAERFPDKQFSTLAYLFSMHPPKHVRPLPNVNIMLCDIDCKREVPLTDNASGRDFLKALEGWAAISDNIFVWDYGINFDNMVAPFPNFHILKKNLQLFKKNHATMVFEQVNGQRGTDFAEMRAYMLAKLMWNPELDEDSLMRSFMEGYYGKAAPWLYRYQQVMQGALLASGVPLWIYDSPISHKDGMLNRQLMQVYRELFDRAEEAVNDDSLRLAHVQVSRLPLQYSELEIARTHTDGDPVAVSRLLAVFRERAARYGIEHLNERNNRVADYCRLYESRYLPRPTTNKAAGATVVWNRPPAPRYRPIADRALTDGLFGGASFVEGWVGWEGEDADFVLDMGETKEFSSVETDFLLQSGGWVLLPDCVTYSCSEDGQAYADLGTYKFVEDRDPSIKFVPGKVVADHPVRARYLRVQVKSIGLCPSWHYGVGYPAWFFLDEVKVE